MTKIDKRKNYIMVLDIETANMVDDPLAYDVGFIIADTKGNIYERFSFMVAELFFDNKDLLKSAYYGKKIPQYWKDYKQGTRTLASIYTIRKKIFEMKKKYNVKEIFAYNANFDLNGLNNTMRYISKSKNRYFFPYGMQVNCIWHIACQTICQQVGYKKFVTEWDLISEQGNFSTSAENVYRYMLDDIFYQEEHMGLEDVLIEYDILMLAFRQKKKIDKSINRACWRLPQEKIQKVA